MPSVEEIIELTIRLGRAPIPRSAVGGVSLNTSHAARGPRRAQIIAAESARLGLPVADPIRGGAAIRERWSIRAWPECGEADRSRFQRWLLPGSRRQGGGDRRRLCDRPRACRILPVAADPGAGSSRSCSRPLLFSVFCSLTFVARAALPDLRLPELLQAAARAGLAAVRARLSAVRRPDPRRLRRRGRRDRRMRCSARRVWAGTVAARGRHRRRSSRSATRRSSGCSATSPTCSTASTRCSSSSRCGSSATAFRAASQPIRRLPAGRSSGLTYFGYNIIGAVVILPVLRHLTERPRRGRLPGVIAGPADDASGAAVLHPDGRLLSRGAERDPAVRFPAPADRHSRLPPAVPGDDLRRAARERHQLGPRDQRADRPCLGGAQRAGR